jgi:poly-gamma-glutamate capsule biosynthesis protein CapA/YwtB (metallophosphatase superfamily)
VRRVGCLYPFAVNELQRDQRRLAPLWVTVLAALLVMATAAAVFGYRPWTRSGRPTAGGTAVAPLPAVSVAGEAVVILGAGDVLVHPELWAQAREDGTGSMNFEPVLAHAAPAIDSADLALCHLGTPVAAPEGPYAGFPRFNVPREVITGIRSAGFDGCSTASSHTLDQGAEGVVRTLDAMDEAGLGHAGTHRSAGEAGRPTIYQVKGVWVAHLSYSSGFDGLLPPAGMEWLADRIDPVRIAADAKAARKAGAQIVVVSMHWGSEYQHEPDLDQQKWARAVAASPDVDVIFGHQADVVQSVEQIAGKWVIYGMGNLIARHLEPINDNREGVMMRLTFVRAATAGRWTVGAIEALPVFVDLNPDIRLIDLERALADPQTSAGRRSIYRAAVERIRGHLLTRGADAAGLIVRGAPAPSPS